MASADIPITVEVAAPQLVPDAVPCRRWHRRHRWTRWTQPFPAGVEGAGIIVAAFTIHSWRQRRGCLVCGLVEERVVKP